MSRGAVRNWRQGVQAPKTPHPRGRRAGRCPHPGGGSALTACRSPGPEAQSGRPKVRPSRLSEDSCQRPVPGSCLSPGARDGRASGFLEGPAAPRRQGPGFPFVHHFTLWRKPQRNSGSVQLRAAGIREPGVSWRPFLLSRGQHREPCLNSERGWPRGFFQPSVLTVVNYVYMTYICIYSFFI